MFILFVGRVELCVILYDKVVRDQTAAGVTITPNIQYEDVSIGVCG